MTALYITIAVLVVPSLSGYVWALNRYIDWLEKTLRDAIKKLAGE